MFFFPVLLIGILLPRLPRATWLLFASLDLAASSDLDSDSRASFYMSADTSKNDFLLTLCLALYHDLETCAVLVSMLLSLTKPARHFGHTYCEAMVSSFHSSKCVVQKH